MIENIWNTFHAQLLGFISSKVGNQDCSEDILQDVFVKVIKNIHTLSDDQKLQPWLYQICRHSIIDYYRAKPSHPQANDQATLDALMADTETHEQQAQLSRCLHTLINALPENVSALLRDSELEQIKQKDMAHKHQLSLAATKSRILRGRALLKKKLMACCEFEFSEQGPQANCQNQCGCQ